MMNNIFAKLLRWLNGGEISDGEWNANTRQISKIYAKAASCEDIINVLNDLKCSTEDLEDYCDYFLRIGLSPSKARDAAMLNADVLRYFLENSHRVIVEGRMTRNTNSDSDPNAGKRVMMKIMTFVHRGSKGDF